MVTEVGPGSASDTDWLAAHDRHISADWMRKVIARGEYLVARSGSERVGFLRFSWFWRTIPYMELIEVLPDYRRRGVGSALHAAWERQMQANGATLLMTSSVRSEAEPQAWHRRNGYRACGDLTFGAAQPEPEAFFVKPLD